MSQIKLLDCTLRDGGYINDWEFGYGNLLSIYERLVVSGVDIIEVGFLDDRRPFDRNRSIMPDTESVSRIWGAAFTKPQMVVGMIDYGTCGIDRLQPCAESYLDGIRIIFKKHIMKEAMQFCDQVKKLGYKVFAQIVSITSYTDEELMELIDLVNEVKPYAVSIVDTYGLLYPNDLLHYYELLDNNVEVNIQIGFHAHNNLQLAYANVITFLEKKSRHDIVIDGTLYGMGKSAGNAPLELIARYLNDKKGKQYKIEMMLEAIQESVMEFWQKASWGYQMLYYMSAVNRCHPNYVIYLKKNENLSVSATHSLLGDIAPEEKKLLYDKVVAEKLSEQADVQFDDDLTIERLGVQLRHKKILLLGPGKTIYLQQNVIEEYIAKEHPVVISVNYIPGQYRTEYVFITNKRRYLEMTEALHMEGNRNIKTIATTNVRCRCGKFNFEVKREPLLEKREQIVDNSFLMLLKVLHRAGIYSVTCAGFDGYSDKDDNYFNPKMEYYFVKDAASHLNRHIRDVIHEEHKDMQIEFLTYSHYTDEDDCYSAAF